MTIVDTLAAVLRKEIRTLGAFLLARIAEDEQAAQAAGTGRWKHRGHDDASNPWIVTAGDDVLIYDEGTPNDFQAAHIARWDPVRVLSECEAKRQIVDWFVEVIGDRDLSSYDQFGRLKHDPQAVAVTLAAETLRLLAAPYGEAPRVVPASGPADS